MCSNRRMAVSSQLDAGAIAIGTLAPDDVGVFARHPLPGCGRYGYRMAVRRLEPITVSFVSRTKMVEDCAHGMGAHRTTQSRRRLPSLSTKLSSRLDHPAGLL
jgi:hypothetical protein